MRISWGNVHAAFQYWLTQYPPFVQIEYELQYQKGRGYRVARLNLDHVNMPKEHPFGIEFRTAREMHNCLAFAAESVAIYKRKVVRG
jgi:hypothetical protein